MHDLLIVGIPLLAILAGILLNRSDASAIRAELRDETKTLRGELHSELRNLRNDMQVQHQEVLARFNVLEADMRQFYHLTGKLEARVDALEKR